MKRTGMVLQTILEGFGLGALLLLVCAVGICKGAVGMVHLYSPAVQQRCVKLGLSQDGKPVITDEQIEELKAHPDCKSYCLFPFPLALYCQ